MIKDTVIYRINGSVTKKCDGIIRSSYPPRLFFHSDHSGRATVFTSVAMAISNPPTLSRFGRTRYVKHFIVDVTKRIFDSRKFSDSQLEESYSIVSEI